MPNLGSDDMPLRFATCILHSHRALASVALDLRINIREFYGLDSHIFRYSSSSLGLSQYFGINMS